MNYKRYKPEGYVTFYYKDKEIHFLFDTKIDMWEEKFYGDFIPGEKFYHFVDDGVITNNDGYCVDVFVDGHRSNLGLYHNGFCSGGFMVTGSDWLNICSEFNVKVVWCNK